MRKIAIVGAAPTSVKDAPYDDPSWEIWCMNESYFQKENYPTWRFDRWFQIDPPVEGGFGPDPHIEMEDHRAWLREVSKEKPVYILETSDFPDAISYPMAEMQERYPTAFLSSSIALMMAYALWTHKELDEKIDTLGVWGADMWHGTEYAKQQWGFWFFKWIAETRGIEVYVPPQSPLAHEPLSYPKKHKLLPQFEARRLFIFNCLQEAVAKAEKLDELTHRFEGVLGYLTPAHPNQASEVTHYKEELEKVKLEATAAHNEVTALHASLDELITLSMNMAR